MEYLINYEVQPNVIGIQIISGNGFLQAIRMFEIKTGRPESAILLIVASYSGPKADNKNNVIQLPQT